VATQGARVERCVELAAECAGCRQHNLAITGLSAAVIQLAARIGTNYLARESAFCSIAVMRRAWTYAIDSQEDAVAYAKRQGIPFQVVEPHEPKRYEKSYADNFSADRKQPWSH